MVGPVCTKQTGVGVAVSGMLWNGSPAAYACAIALAWALAVSCEVADAKALAAACALPLLSADATALALALAAALAAWRHMPDAGAPRSCEERQHSCHACRQITGTGSPGVSRSGCQVVPHTRMCKYLGEVGSQQVGAEARGPE